MKKLVFYKEDNTIPPGKFVGYLTDKKKRIVRYNGQKIVIVRWTKFPDKKGRCPEKHFYRNQCIIVPLWWVKVRVFFIRAAQKMMKIFKH